MTTYHHEFVKKARMGIGVPLWGEINLLVAYKDARSNFKWASKSQLIP